MSEPMRVTSDGNKEHPKQQRQKAIAAVVKKVQERSVGDVRDIYVPGDSPEAPAGYSQLPEIKKFKLLQKAKQLNASRSIIDR